MSMGNAPRKRRSTRPQWVSGGFTLLELIIALSITALILVVVFGSFRVGVRAWEKGEAEVEVRQRERIVMEIVKRQLSSMVLWSAKKTESLPFSFGFQGDNKSMSFVSRIPLVAFHAYGVVFVRYAVFAGGRGEGERLSFFEENVDLLMEDFSAKEVAEEDYFELLSGPYRIHFAYMKQPDDDSEVPQWQDAWDPETDEGYPQAVKITFEKETDGVAPVKVIARIEPEPEKG